MDELTQSEVKKVDAQPNIGAMHEQDLQQAADWYRKAAEQGYADAQFQLGRIYHKNQTEPSNLHVAPWYREAPNWVPVFLCKHRYALAVVVGLIVVAIFLLPATEDILERPLGLELPITATDASANENNSDSNDIPIDATLQWQSYLVRNGENLTAIFNNLGLSTTTLYKVLDADNNNVLARLKPGQTIELQIGQDNILQQLKIRLNIKQTLLMVHSDDAYTASMINEKVEWQLQRYNGVINGSFYVSARNAGIPANHIQKIANLFQWRMNFAQVLKKGDTFKVLVRQEVVEGKSTGDSQLLGVEVTNQGNQVSAWLAEDGNYYDGGGNSLEQRKPARSSVESSRTELSMAEPLSGKDRRRFLALVEQYRQALNSNGEGELKLRLVNIPLPGLEAITKYRKAAEQGNASAQYNLGLMYEQGHGVAQDNKEAIAWYRKAAEQGDARAQYNLGIMYVNGHGVAQDYKQASVWYRKAAEQGNASAQNNLGVMYDNGLGVARDYKQAVSWYRKAAEQGNATAQNNLGVMYEQGRGVERDNKEAVTWYRTAAEQGNANALVNLRTTLANGQEVVQDDELALAWRRLAAKSTDTEVMSCKGFDDMMRELGNLQLMDDKYKEVKAKLDAIDERRTQAVIDGNSAENMDDNRDEKVLINEVNILKRVAEKKSVVLGEWWGVCAADIADRRAEVYQLKKTKAEADKQAKIAAERKHKAAEQAKLQQKMKAMLQQPNARSQAASAAAQGEIDKYAALIKATVERYMILDPTMRGKTCTIGVRLASSGFVISVDNGQGDPAVCRSGKAAVLKANQLPVPKDPAAFEMLKEFNLKLEPNI